MSSWCWEKVVLILRDEDAEVEVAVEDEEEGPSEATEDGREEEQEDGIPMDVSKIEKESLQCPTILPYMHS